MDTILILSFTALAFGLSVVIFWFMLRAKTKEKTDDIGLKLILEQMNELNRTVDSKIGESSRMMQSSVSTQFSESQKLIREITRELTEVKETGRQVIGFADQLQSLSDILKNPKQRGILGEYYLETLLKNTMPPGSYQMQYAFPDGTIVDAAVFVKDKIIPIDSKFSLENYNRIVEERDENRKKEFEKVFVSDLKNRITETSKYIQPKNGTMDFAFMFIPHEAIYYDLLINKIGIQEEGENLIQKAAGKYKVMIVSPTSFLAYLQTVLQGLRALQIEDTAKDIIKNVSELGKHLQAYEEHHAKLGNALSTTVNHFNATQKDFRQIDKDVLKITGEALSVSSLPIEGPNREE